MSILPSNKERFWRDHLQAWQSSAVNQSASCREHGLVAHQFSYWKRRLNALSAEPEAKSDAHSSAMIPLSVSNTFPASGLSLRLPNGCEVSGLQAEHLPLVKPLLEMLL